MTEQKQQLGNGISHIPVDSVPTEVAAYMQNMNLMNQIVQEMKEIPILESEKPTDTNALTKVEFPEEGGVLTYMDNHPFPYRGFPYFEFVEKIDLIKKLSRGMLSGLYHSVFKRSRLVLLLMFPLLFVARDLVFTGVYTYSKLIQRFRVKQTRYSRAIRALHTAFDTPRANEDIKTLELRLMLKDLVCMFLEFDNAYRYRFQDVIVELDKIAVKENPVKEILRLLEIMNSRENTPEVRDSWTLIKMGVKYYMRFDPKLKRMLADVLATLDLEKVALTEEDKHFSGLRKDYNFKFKTCQQ